MATSMSTSVSKNARANTSPKRAGYCRQKCWDRTQDYTLKPTIQAHGNDVCVREMVTDPIRYLVSNVNKLHPISVILVRRLAFFLSKPTCSYHIWNEDTEEITQKKHVMRAMRLRGPCLGKVPFIVRNSENVHFSHQLTQLQG